MLSLLLELFVSLVLCGVFVFFAFLNAPAEAGPTSADDDDDTAAATTPAGGDALYEPALLPLHELPLFSLLSRYVALDEDTSCGIAYRWLLTSALHYSAREVYSEALLREWESGVGDGTGGGEEGEGETSGLYGSRAQHQALASSSHSPSPAAAGGSAGMAGSRRTRRRPRRGGAPALAAAPTPLRRESAHWVNVVLRWAAFLCLGGGTVRPEVWTDHLLFHTEKVLGAVNAGYAEKMRARALMTRMMGSQLMGASGQPQPQRPLAPQQLHSSTAAAALQFGVAKPLVRVEQMELGAGLLGGPSRAQPLLSSVINAAAAAADGHGRGLNGEVPALPGTLSPSLSAAQATVLTSPTLGGVAGTVAPPPGGSGAASGTSPLRSTHAIQQQQQPQPQQQQQQQQAAQNSAIAAAGVLLSSSVAGLGSVLADVVSSVTTGHGGLTSRGAAAGEGGSSGGGGGPGSTLGDYAAAAAATTSVGITGNGSGGAQLGVVLPRVEGDVISVEEPFHEAMEGGAAAAPVVPTSSADSKPASLPPSLPLRCFAVPLFYNDQRFHLRLGCSLPLGALLPISLCVPPDVLTLDCAVAVRRVIFSGHLHAALHGNHVELSFPVAPQFTAVIAVTPDYAGGMREGQHGGNSSGNVTPGHPGGGGGGGYPSPQHPHYHQQQHVFHSSLSPAGASVGAARTLGHTFTAVNTTRNEATTVRESGAGGREGSPSVRPPMLSSAALPPFTPRSSAYHALHHPALYTAASSPSNATTTTTGTSSINERNEKVQEVVLLAVRRLIQSLTYPNVLAGQIVCLPAASSGNAGGGGGGGGEAAMHSNTLSMKWQRATATLPLRM